MLKGREFHKTGEHTKFATSEKLFSKLVPKSICRDFSMCMKLVSYTCWRHNKETLPVAASHVICMQGMWIKFTIIMTSFPL